MIFMSNAHIIFGLPWLCLLHVFCCLSFCVTLQAGVVRVTGSTWPVFLEHLNCLKLSLECWLSQALLYLHPPSTMLFVWLASALLF